MWNDNKSIILSRVCVIAFMILLVAMAVFAPWFVRTMFMTAELTAWESYFLYTIYVGCVPAALLLISLFRLIRRIEKGEVFIQKNVDSLRIISWYCFFGAAVSAVSIIYYYPWVIVTIAAAFMGLVVRVVKNVFARAVSLQDDADFTI